MKSERFERVRISPVVSEISDPKNEDVGVEVHSVAEPCDVPVCSEFESAKFDLMQIKITIYGLSGVMRKHRSDKKVKKSPWKKRMPTGSTASTRHSKETVGIHASMSDLTTAQDVPPVTAFVSCQRNVSSSGTSIQTFLPSLPMNSPASEFGSTMTRFFASWPAGEPSFHPEEDELDESSTFKMLRVLKRESYRSGMKPGQLPHYVPETIDLKVGVGCGKDIIDLGIASFAISGDEESEFAINVPAKQIAPTLSRVGMMSPARRTKKLPVTCFSHCPQQEYFLDENATLRIGVQVLPQSAAEETAARLAAERTLEEQTLEKLLSGIIDEEQIVEIADQVGILQPTIAPNENAPPVESRPQAVFREAPMTPNVATHTFFCGAMTAFPFACAPSRVTSREPAVPEKILTVNQENDPRHLPLTLLSSVSESITTIGSPSTAAHMYM